MLSILLLFWFKIFQKILIKYSQLIKKCLDFLFSNWILKRKTKRISQRDFKNLPSIHSTQYNNSHSLVEQAVSCGLGFFQHSEKNERTDPSNRQERSLANASQTTDDEQQQIQPLLRLVVVVFSSHSQSIVSSGAAIFTFLLDLFPIKILTPKNCWIGQYNYAPES